MLNVECSVVLKEFCATLQMTLPWIRCYSYGAFVQFLWFFLLSNDCMFALFGSLYGPFCFQILFSSTDTYFCCHEQYANRLQGIKIKIRMLIRHYLHLKAYLPFTKTSFEANFRNSFFDFVFWLSSFVGNCFLFHLPSVFWCGDETGDLNV